MKTVYAPGTYQAQVESWRETLFAHPEIGFVVGVILLAGLAWFVTKVL